MQRVDLIGYDGAKLCTALQEKVPPRGNVHVTLLPAYGGAPLRCLDRFFLTRAFFKIVAQFSSILYVLLFVVPSMDVLLVQTPPAMYLFIYFFIYLFFLEFST